MGDGLGGSNLTFLIAKERLSKAVMGTVVPSKSTGEFAARRVLAFMREFGCDYTEINMKSDNEPALKVLVENVGRLRAAHGAGRMNIENSPAYSSRSNGVIERGVQTVQGQLRVMRSASGGEAGHRTGQSTCNLGMDGGVCLLPDQPG